MQADGTLKAAKPPRGLGFMTGEQLPDAGESGTARLFVVDIARGEIQITDELTELQDLAHQGYLARAMRGFIEWLLPQMDELPDRLRALFVETRKWAASTGIHRRQPETIAWLLVGYSVMLRYFQYAGLGIDGMWNEAQGIILDHSEAQAVTLQDENPVTMFFNALDELHIINEARALSVTSAPPGTMDDIVAFIDQQYIYLLPGPAYGKVSEFYRAQGTLFPIRKGELWKRLAEQGIIATWGKETTKTKHIPNIGTGRYVWIHKDKAGTLFSRMEQK